MTNATMDAMSDELPPPVPPADVPPMPPADAPPVPPADAPPPAPTDEPGERRRSTAHIVAIVIGGLMLLPALGITAGGVATTVAATAGTDGDGYFDATLDRLESDGVAIATFDVWDDTTDDDDWPVVLDWLDLDLRITADGAGGSDDVFLGVARSSDVEEYLDDVAFSEVVDIDNRSARYIERSGAPTIAPPDDQDFWTASSSGTGEQELDWEARGGTWSIVLLNSDGSAGVAADVEVGVKSGALLPIGITVLVFGGILTLGSIVLIVIGARGRRA